MTLIEFPRRNGEPRTFNEAEHGLADTVRRAHRALTALGDLDLTCPDSKTLSTLIALLDDLEVNAEDIEPEEDCDGEEEGLPLFAVAGLFRRWLANTSSETPPLYNPGSPPMRGPPSEAIPRRDEGAESKGATGQRGEGKAKGAQDAPGRPVRRRPHPGSYRQGPAVPLSTTELRLQPPPLTRHARAPGGRGEERD